MLYNNYTQQQYKSHHVIIPATQTTGALLLGDLNAATDQEVIKQYNIKTIITAASGLEHLKMPSDLTHVVFPLLDTKQQNIEVYFELSFRTIEENLKRGSVLVHCGAGISRSASLIIAYYMKKFNSTFKNAISHIKNIKPNICPNLGFQLQLKNYQNQLNLQKQKSSSPRTKNFNSKVLQKNNIIPSSYVFQIPIQNNHPNGLKTNVRTMNKMFNKTHGGRIHNSKIQSKSQLFIEGKNPKEKLNQFEKNVSLYQPQKYSRKYNAKQRQTVSTAKKIKQQSFPFYKF